MRRSLRRGGRGLSPLLRFWQHLLLTPALDGHRTEPSRAARAAGGELLPR